MASHVLTQTFATGASHDGTVIVGYSPSGGQNCAAWWDQAGTLTLLTMPASVVSSQATSCSDDGSVIVGWGTDSSGRTRAFWWDKTSGTPTSLPGVGGNTSGDRVVQAFGCSGDGSIVAGTSQNGGVGKAVWWDKTTTTITVMDNLPGSTGGSDSGAVGISQDGTTMVGNAVDSGGNNQPVWWDKSTGAVTQMTWPHAPESSSQGPVDCSGDGSVIVGTTDDGTSNFTSVACWWDKSTGLGTILDQLPSSTNGSAAAAVSDDGLTIAGNALDSSGNEWGVIWSKIGGAITQLPYPSDANFFAEANGISGDGTIGVGDYNTVSADVALYWDLVEPTLTMFLTARGLSAARGSARPVFALSIRGRGRAGGTGKAALSWSSFSLPLNALTRAGARAAATALVPGMTSLSGRSRTGARGRAALSGVTTIPVFPALPVGFPVTVKPTFATVAGETPSGRSMRAFQQTIPIWEFELNFEILRDQTQNATPYAGLAGFTELTRLAQLFIASIGQYGQFLFDAWWDDSRLDQEIAFGDGSSTRFRMVRTWGFGSIQVTEPVGSVNVVTNVKLNGVVEDPSQYFITSNNVLVFRSAPFDGALITATFSYYYLCQFSEDMQDYSEFMKNRWTAKIKFRSVEGATPFTLSGSVVFPNPVPPPTPPSPSSLPASASVNAIVGDLLTGDLGQPWNNASLAGAWRLPPSMYPVTGLLTNGIIFNSLPGGGSNSPNIIYALTSDGAFGFGNSQSSKGAMFDMVTGVETDFQQEASTFGDVVFGCSDDGTVAVGQGGTSVDTAKPLLWTGTGSRPVTVLPMPSSGILSGSAFNCDATGIVIVGQSANNVILNRRVLPCFWPTAGSQPTFLATINAGGGENSPGGEARACSIGGGLIVGWTLINGSNINIGNYPGAPISGIEAPFMPCYWYSSRPNTVVLLSLPTGWIAGKALAVSADGSVAIGWGVANDANGTIYPLVWNVFSNTVTVLPGQSNWPSLPSNFNFVVGGVGISVSRDGTRAGGLVPAIQIVAGNPVSITIAKYWDL